MKDHSMPVYDFSETIVPKAGDDKKGRSQGPSRQFIISLYIFLYFSITFGDTL